MKKIIAIIISVIMIMGIMPVTSFAATEEIALVQIGDIKAPVAGAHPDYVATYGSGYNFITEFDKTSEELLTVISNSKSNYIYIVTDDNAKRRELIKIIPEYCGIFCNSNPFGLGMLTQILREPQFLETR